MPLLILYKQIGDMQLPAEKLQEMMSVLIPSQVVMLEMKIKEMLDSGDEDVHVGQPQPVHPINN